MITAEMPQYDETIEISLETVIQKEDEILVDIADEHACTRQSIQDVGQDINSKISMINGNIDLPLNERPIMIADGKFDVLNRTTIVGSASGSYFNKKQKSFSDVNNAYFVYNWSSNSSGDATTIARLEISTGIVTKIYQSPYGNLNVSYIPQDNYFCNELTNTTYLVLADGKQISKLENMNTVFTTLPLTCNAFYIKETNIYYVNGNTSIYKWNIGEGKNELIGALKENIGNANKMWSWNGYWYHRADSGSVYKITLEPFKIEMLNTKMPNVGRVMKHYGSPYKYTFSGITYTGVFDCNQDIFSSDSINIEVPKINEKELPFTTSNFIEVSDNSLIIQTDYDSVSMVLYFRKWPLLLFIGNEKSYFYVPKYSRIFANEFLIEFDKLSKARNKLIIPNNGYLIEKDLYIENTNKAITIK